MVTNTLIFPPVDFEIQAATEPESFFDEQKVLMVGEKLAAGTATAEVLVTNITPQTDINTLFGARAILTNMIIAFFRINPNTPLDVIPVEISGTDATGSFTISGTATSKGRIELAIFSDETGKITLDVAVGDTGAEVATAANAAFALLPNLPVDIILTTGLLSITAANPGTLGNRISLGKTITPATGFGITVVNGDFLTGGTGTFVDSDIFSAVGGERYQTIIYTEDLPISRLQTFLDVRFTDANDILDGIGVVTFEDTVANLVTTSSSLTSKSLMAIASPVIASDTVIYEFSSVISAIVGGVRAIRLTENINITSFLSGAIGKDTLGGPSLAGRPYANTPLLTMPIKPIEDAPTETQIADLKTLGFTLLHSNSARDSALLGEAFTQSSEASFRFINTIDTISAVREFFFNSFKILFAQARITTGDLVEGRPMVNENSFITTSNQLYSQLADEFNLTVSGEAALKIFKAGTVISLNKITGTVTVLYNEVPIVSQNRRTSTVVKIEFTVQDS